MIRITKASYGYMIETDGARSHVVGLRKKRRGWSSYVMPPNVKEIKPQPADPVYATPTEAALAVLPAAQHEEAKRQIAQLGGLHEEYRKTDADGTRHYRSHACGRCGGFGYIEYSSVHDAICFRCGGSGQRKTPKTVKEYTPEYKAARRAALKAQHEELRAAEASEET